MKALLKGEFEVVGFPELLQVTALGRQFVSIDVLDEADELLGRVGLKGGMVVLAETRHGRGKAAFFELLAEPHARSFRAFNVLQFPAQWPPPIGPLDILLLQAAMADEPAARVEEPARWSLEPAQPVAPTVPVARVPAAPARPAPWSGPRGSTSLSPRLSGAATGQTSRVAKSRRRRSEPGLSRR